MSSFLHSANHFNSVEQGIINLIQRNANYYLPYSFKKLLPEAYQKSHNQKTHKMGIEIKDFMNCIRSISVLCVNLQYKHHSTNVDEDIQNELFELMTNKKESTVLKPIDLLKALQSINYQIEIEHLKELRELTPKETASIFILNELINSIAMYIVTNTEDYNNSKGWSL
jgi:hypothetical protein